MKIRFKLLGFVLIVVAMLFLSGCLSQITGPSEAEKQAATQAAAQKQAAIQKCQTTYGSCQTQCKQNWLASDKANCNIVCTDNYQVCMSYT